MEIRYKLYPYPVLAYYSDNYKMSSFDVTIDFVRDGYNIRTDFVAALSNQELMSLIKLGNACFAYHLECAQTGYREIIKTQDSATSYTLSNKKVTGRLQICPFIVSLKDLHGYTNKDLDDDYAGMTFDIEAGCILAVGKQVNADISKIQPILQDKFRSSLSHIQKCVKTQKKEWLRDVCASINIVPKEASKNNTNLGEWYEMLRDRVKKQLKK